MFSMTEAIAGWRQTLADSGSFSSEQLAELEDHLISLIDSRRAAGKQPEQAFAEAVQQLGGTDEIAREYRRNDLSEQWRVLLSDDAVLNRMLGLLILGGSVCHVLYGLRFMNQVPAYFSQSFTVALMGVFLWVSFQGLRMLQGKARNSVFLMLFFLVQVPVLYLPNMRYDFFSSLAITLNLGDAPELFGYGLGGKLSVHLGEAQRWHFVGINLFALVMVVLMVLKLTLDRSRANGMTQRPT